MNTEQTGSTVASSVSWWQRHARRLWLFLRVIAVIAGLVAIAWWLYFSPVVVTAHVVSAGSVDSEVFGTGTLEPRVSAAVGPKVTGLITSVGVDQGDMVEAGDVLVTLEDTNQRLLVAVAEAELAAVRASIDRLIADRGRAEAVLAQARLTSERLTAAAAAGAAGAEEVDKSREAVAIAEAELARAAAALIEGHRRAAATESSLEYERARLQDMSVLAPFDGPVLRRDRDQGDVVTAGSVVLQLASLNEVWVTAWVDETELARLAVDQPARVVFRSEPETKYEGVVARIGRETDRETREVVVDVRVDGLPVNWAAGQRADVYILVDRRDGVTVLPAALALVREGKAGVWVDDDGAARWREITVGLRGRDAVEVVDGLAPGDTVLTASGGRSGSLRQGRRVARR
ncbi:MAG: efflux RND transporter periplasmic adaptor subunit [Phycisphaerales bacterium]|nr:efflux RND transporter periplasmic adaptor subunit [Phycisphaerales bacterium]